MDGNEMKYGQSAEDEMIDDSESRAKGFRTPLVPVDKKLLDLVGNISGPYQAVMQPIPPLQAPTLPVMESFIRRRSNVSLEMRNIVLKINGLGTPYGVEDEVAELWEQCSPLGSDFESPDRVGFHVLFREFIDRNPQFLQSISTWLTQKNVRVVGSPDIVPSNRNDWRVIDASPHLLDKLCPQVKVRKLGVVHVVDLFSIFCGIQL